MLGVGWFSRTEAWRRTNDRGGGLHRLISAFPSHPSCPEYEEDRVSRGRDANVSWFSN
jgi:hypothetical protein